MGGKGRGGLGTMVCTSFDFGDDANTFAARSCGLGESRRLVGDLYSR